MKRAFAFPICMMLIFGSPVPVLALDGVPDGEINAVTPTPLGLSVEVVFGEREPEYETAENAEAKDIMVEYPDSGEAVWDVDSIYEDPQYDTVYVAVGSQPVLPSVCPVFLSDQNGNLDGHYFWFVDWSKAEYSTETAGKQIIYGVIDTENEHNSGAAKFIFNEKYYRVALKLIVLEPQLPDLVGSNLRLFTNRNKLVYLEVKFPQRIDHWDELILQVSMDEGESWQDAPVTPQSGVLINLGPLEEDMEYYYQLEVKGSGVVRGLSDILALKIEGGILETWKGHSGHRDGDHQDEQPEPSPSTPPPSTSAPPSEPPAIPAPSVPSDPKPSPDQGGEDRDSRKEGAVYAESSEHMESTLPKDDEQAIAAAPEFNAVPPQLLRPVANGEQSDEDSVTLSGKRLAALMEGSDTVPFVKNGVQLLFPSEALRELNMGDDDLFTVILQNPDRNLLRVGFYLNESFLSDPFIASFDIFFPYQPEDGESTGSIVCIDASGNEVPTHCAAEGGRLAFSLDSAGEYVIRSEAAIVLTEVRHLPQLTDLIMEDEPGTPSAPATMSNIALWVPISITALVAGLLFVWRYWRKSGSRV